MTKLIVSARTNKVRPHRPNQSILSYPTVNNFHGIKIQSSVSGSVKNLTWYTALQWHPPLVL